MPILGSHAAISIRGFSSFFTNPVNPNGNILEYGRFAAMNNDGSIVAISIDNVLSSPDLPSALYIYYKNDTTWYYGSTFFNSTNPPSSGYGFTCDMTNDGNTVITGAPTFDTSSPGNPRGRIFVYKKLGTTWYNSQVLQDNTTVNLGTVVAISGDGNQIVTTLNINSNFYVAFTWNGSIYTGSTYFSHSGIRYAWSTAINFDGTYFASISPNETLGFGNFRNQLNIFNRSGSTWTVQLTDVYGITQSTFGTNGIVRINDAGDIVVVADSSLGSLGTVRIYTRSGSTWTHTNTVTPHTNVIGGFGSGLSMNAAGTKLGINATITGGSNVIQIYNNVGGTWTYDKQLSYSSSPWTELGTNQSMSGDGAFIAYPSYRSPNLDNDARYVILST